MLNYLNILVAIHPTTKVSGYSRNRLYKYYSVMTDRYDMALQEVNDDIETYLLASKHKQEVNTNEKHNQT
jgi:hypothetical protein